MYIAHNHQPLATTLTDEQIELRKKNASDILPKPIKMLLPLLAQKSPDLAAQMVAENYVLSISPIRDLSGKLKLGVYRIDAENKELLIAF